MPLPISKHVKLSNYNGYHTKTVSKSNTVSNNKHSNLAKKHNEFNNINFNSNSEYNLSKYLSAFSSCRRCYCGRSKYHLANALSCPAKILTCMICHKKGHFGRVCHQKRQYVNRVLTANC